MIYVCVWYRRWPFLCSDDENQCIVDDKIRSFCFQNNLLFHLFVLYSCSRQKLVHISLSKPYFSHKSVTFVIFVLCKWLWNNFTHINSWIILVNNIIIVSYLTLSVASQRLNGPPYKSWSLLSLNLITLHSFLSLYSYVIKNIMSVYT